MYHINMTGLLHFLNLQQVKYDPIQNVLYTPVFEWRYIQHSQYNSKLLAVSLVA
jgi:hypothetical protein